MPQHLTDYVVIDIAVERTASGGFGSVFMGPNQRPGGFTIGQWYALKTMKPAILSHPRARELFIREALTWCGLWLHANILTAQAVTEINAQPFLVLDYAERGSLRDLLRVGQPFEVRLLWAQMIAAGLDALHTPDPDHLRPDPIAHRDLKPENVLVNQPGYAMISDFGLSKVVQQSDAVLLSLPPSDDPTRTQGVHTARGTALGTPAYMAPEQWEDAATAGTPADLYAFGQMLSELLAGRMGIVPHLGQQWRYAHALNEPRPLREVVPQLPAEVEDLYQHCLAKAPEQRPTAREALAVLQAGAQAMRHRPYEVQEVFPHTPDNERMKWENWAVAYYRFSLHNEAWLRYNHALDFAPNHPQVHSNRGMCLLSMQRYEEALVDIEFALARTPEQDPRYLTILSMKANCLSDMRRYAEAEAAYAQVMVLDSAGANKWFNRSINERDWGQAEAASGHLDASRQHYERGVDYVQRAIAINPDDPGFQRILAELRQLLAQVDV